MVTRHVRHPELLIMLSLVFTTLALAVQKTAPATPDFLPEEGVPGGPFLFERGTSRPTHMDAFDGRPVVKSPDGRLGVTVTGPKESYGAWVTISPSTFPGGPVQVWPMQASVSVLWRRDSQAFALTDNRYANLSYVFVCGTEFRMGESEPGLGVPITDLTPIVRKAFEEHAGKYYERENYDTLLFYAMVLRWIGNDDLLVGVSARTSGPPTFPEKDWRERGLKEWDVAYLVDVPNEKVVREVGKDQLLSEYKIKVNEH
jgi:hypothetical protein